MVGLAEPSNNQSGQITVQITNVTDRAAQVDGRNLPFAPGQNSANLSVAPGAHLMAWQVMGSPGTDFVFSLAGATSPITFQGGVDQRQRASGEFHFNVA